MAAIVAAPDARAVQQQQQQPWVGALDELRLTLAPGASWYMPIISTAFATAKLVGRISNLATDAAAATRDAATAVLGGSADEAEVPALAVNSSISSVSNPSVSSMSRRSSTLGHWTTNTIFAHARGRTSSCGGSSGGSGAGETGSSVSVVKSVLQSIIRSRRDSVGLLTVFNRYPHHLQLLPDTAAALLDQAAAIWSTQLATAAARLPQPQQQQLPAFDVAALLAADSSSEQQFARQLHTQLIDWYTVEQKQSPSLAAAVHKQHYNSSNSSCTGDYSCYSAAAFVPANHRAEALAKLLCFTVDHPSIVDHPANKLKVLLKQLQHHLQWLQPQMLLDLYSRLMNWDSLSTWPQQQLHKAAADLLHAVISQLQQQVQAVQQLGTQQQQHQQIVSFAAVAPQLLRLASDACVACTIGHTNEQAGGSPGYRPSQQVTTELSTKLTTQLAQWRKLSSTAAGPTMEQAVLAAAAEGQLQQIASMLGTLFGATVRQLVGTQSHQQLQQHWQQQLHPCNLAELLVLLSSAQPYWRPVSEAPAAAASSTGSFTGSVALQKLAESVIDYLYSPQPQQQKQQKQHEPAELLAATAGGGHVIYEVPQPTDSFAAAVYLPLADLDPSLIVKGLQAATALKLPWNDIMTALCDTATPYHKSGSSSSRSLEPACTAPGQPLLHRWELADLHSLLDFWVETKYDKQHAYNCLAAAAAVQVQQLSDHLRDLGNSSSSLTGMQRWLPNAICCKELNGTGDAGTYESYQPQQHQQQQQILKALANRITRASAIVHMLQLQGQYHPVLLDALGGLLIACTAARSAWNSQMISSSSKRRKHLLSPLDGYNFIRIAGALAYFHHCSRGAAEAVRFWTSQFLMHHKDLRNVVRLAWALAVLDQRDWSLWVDIQQVLKQLQRKQDWGEHERMIATQLHQTNLFVQLCVPGVSLLPEHLAHAAKDAYDENMNDISVSRLQRDVSHEVSALLTKSSSNKFSGHQLEVRSALGSIDMVVSCHGGHKIALEVDGPFHFANNNHQKRLGSAELRDRLLTKLGYKVCPLSCFVWQQWKSSSADKSGKLERIILEAAAKELQVR
eukprot:GHRR01013243.1.p1 GENE.GHRR01013243.1~~GHRR01013243.1.p1  ORF type:complete len:1082 (+),score=470.16 GHRR01013243.1:30-3248(+)